MLIIYDVNICNSELNIKVSMVYISQDNAKYIIIFALWAIILRIKLCKVRLNFNKQKKRNSKCLST